MTKQKKHKKRVRAVATETGQRYTEALVNRQPETEDSLEAARKLLDHPWPDATEEDISYLSSDAFRTGRYPDDNPAHRRGKQRIVYGDKPWGEWTYDMTARALTGKNWTGLANAINELAEGLGTPVAHPAVANALGITPANVPWFEVWVLKGDGLHVIYLGGKTINPRPFRLKDNSPRPNDVETILAEQRTDQKVVPVPTKVFLGVEWGEEPPSDPFDPNGSSEYLADHLATFKVWPVPDGDPRPKTAHEWLARYRPDLDAETASRIVAVADRCLSVHPHIEVSDLVSLWPVPNIPDNWPFRNPPKPSSSKTDPG